MRRCLPFLLLAALSACGGNKTANSAQANASTALPSDATANLAHAQPDPDANATDDSLGSINGQLSNLAADTADAAANGIADNQAAAPAAGDLAYCAIIQDRVTPADCAHYEEIWERLAQGRAALDVPQQMGWKQPYRVSFAIVRDDPNDRGSSDRRTEPENLLDSSAERTADLRVGRKMIARLSGDGFRVEPQGAEQQDLGAGGAARWDWIVTPERDGRRALTLNAYVVVETPSGQRSENLIRTLSQDVDVAVSAGDKAKRVMEDGKGWLGLANELLLALAALIGGGLLAVWLAVGKFKARKASDAGSDDAAA